MYRARLHIQDRRCLRDAGDCSFKLSRLSQTKSVSYSKPRPETRAPKIDVGVIAEEMECLHKMLGGLPDRIQYQWQLSTFPEQPLGTAFLKQAPSGSWILAPATGYYALPSSNYRHHLRDAHGTPAVTAEAWLSLLEPSLLKYGAKQKPARNAPVELWSTTLTMS